MQLPMSRLPAAHSAAPATRRRFLGGLAGAAVAGPLLAAPSRTEPALKAEDWVFIDNGKLRLGVKRASGAGIGWLSASGSKENLLDHWDHGRLIQQSYYGKEDGSRWVDKPWRWNPVQGGDYRGQAAEVLELQSDAVSLTARIRPRNWAGGQLLGDCEMRQRIRLEGDLVIARMGFRYTGKESHPAVHHEVPAVFLAPRFATLVHYQGDQAWTGGALQRSRPGWPNESRSIPEHWAAYVDEEDRGLGVFVPIAQELTCYRFGASEAAAGACSYFARLVTFAITPGLDFSYDMVLAVGRPPEMRAAFAGIKDRLAATLPASQAK